MSFKSISKYGLTIIGCAVLLLVTGHYAQAQKKILAPGVFYKANDFFQKGEYEQAKQAYMEIVESQVDSGNIYYNLGNAFFKLGQNGRAIVNYERAKRLLPHDSDIAENLKYAKSLCNNSVVPLKENWFIVMGKNIAHNFTLNGWTKIFAVIYFLTLVMAGCFILTKVRVFKKAVLCFGIGLCFISSIWLIKFYQIRIVEKAIVVVSEIDSRFAPASDAVVHFKAYEGASIEIVDSNSTWVRIKTPDGKIGWVPGNTVEKI